MELEKMFDVNPENLGTQGEAGEKSTEPTGDNSDKTETPVDYSSYLPKIEIEEGQEITPDEKVKKQFEAFKDNAVNEYKKSLSEDTRIYIEASTSGADPAVIKKQKEQANFWGQVKNNLTNTSEDQFIQIYSKLKNEENKSVAAAAVKALAEEDSLISTIEALIDNETTNLNKEVEESIKNWETKVTEAGNNHKKVVKPTIEVLENTDELLGITLNPEDKTAIEKLFAPKVAGKDEKGNPINTTALAELLSVPENQLKLALIIDKGLFDDKINLGNNTAQSEADSEDNGMEGSNFENALNNLF